MVDSELSFRRRWPPEENDSVQCADVNPSQQCVIYIRSNDLLKRVPSTEYFPAIQTSICVWIALVHHSLTLLGLIGGKCLLNINITRPAAALVPEKWMCVTCSLRRWKHGLCWIFACAVALELALTATPAQWFTNYDHVRVIQLGYLPPTKWLGNHCDPFISQTASSSNSSWLQNCDARSPLLTRIYARIGNRRTK